jgi:hypothetical protein
MNKPRPAKMAYPPTAPQQVRIIDWLSGDMNPGWFSGPHTYATDQICVVVSGT